jgi:hypothetical protein
MEFQITMELKEHLCTFQITRMILTISKNSLL